ncbi:uncharacterized protein LOC127248790 [Andrographis paniculata]|uniref:uncharacterized protein LOC127248790 n=1 Tax=Andrographis paniculata TaxID=175694 RepID=UPI0021E7CD69|nr:uncharacterized protein LOC127248790 [Andrographis paniculata]XP_051127272.1 uncharacterized protein LOC127248790 [Andrographis paniculata]XP_051127273.1 uncharacterized protein LOC127248790 [Andrographis paniculata]XP_051127274.1 uncharacterized protein LOC127248790 [Andrographis paniculata]
MRPIVFRISFLATANLRQQLKNSPGLAFSTVQHPNQVSNYHNRRQEEEGRSVRVSVWWDFENCSLPVNTNVFKVTQGITNAVRANGIKGPIQVTAFGDVMQISRINQEALSATGINLCHVPSGGKNSADRSLLVDLMYWVSQNPPPAHIFLISGDRDFAGILHKLRMSNYNILLASPDSAPNVLISAATIMWHWSSLLKGENITGRFFNQPPDGPYNSWYGQYRTPIEDPFAVVEHQTSCLPAEELVESKVRPIPKSVMKQIRHILNSYPDGIAISQLGTELNKCNLTIDKDFYGYRKLSRFLSAMPHVVKLIHLGKDQYIVKGTNSRYADEPIPTSSIRELEGGKFSKVDSEISSGDDISKKNTASQIPELKVNAEMLGQHDTSTSINTPIVKVKNHSKSSQDPKREEELKESPRKRSIQEIQEQDRNIKLQEKPKKFKAASTAIESKDISQNDEKQGVGPDEVSHSESGIFRRLWTKWFASVDMNDKEKNLNKCEEMKGAKDNIGKKTVVPCKSFQYMYPALFSPSSHEALIDDRIPRDDGTVPNVPAQGSGFLNKKITWLKYWNSLEFDNKVDKNGEVMDQVKVSSKQLELFSKASFWKELESFLDTTQGAAVFSQSRTRENLVQNLQKQGPLMLKSLPESDLLHLIDLLISDKKWVEECCSEAFPFRLVRLTEKDQINNPPAVSNGLSLIFEDREPNLQQLGNRKHQNPPHTGVTQNVVAHRGSSSKSRNQLLADCQKLVDHILKEYPDGFNTGLFGKLFVEKFGYALDLQKHGYEKLQDLLRTIPGVELKSNLLFPAGAFKNLETDLSEQESKIAPTGESCDESFVSPNNDDDSDSSWDELGPLDNSGLGLTGKTQKRETEHKVPDYEPLNVDNFSDSEEEKFSLSESEVKSKQEEERSSLLQILDSWYGDEKGDNRMKDQPVDSKKLIDIADSSWLQSKPSGPKAKTPSVATSHLKRCKPSKMYSFVAEQPFDNNDKLVDGMLSSLKKSSAGSPDSSVVG